MFFPTPGTSRERDGRCLTAWEDERMNHARTKPPPVLRDPRRRLRCGGPGGVLRPDTGDEEVAWRPLIPYHPPRSIGRITVRRATF